jgi:hypothetical protein
MDVVATIQPRIRRKSPSPATWRNGRIDEDRQDDELRDGEWRFRRRRCQRMQESQLLERLRHLVARAGSAGHG